MIFQTTFLLVNITNIHYLFSNSFSCPSIDIRRHWHINANNVPSCQVYERVEMEDHALMASASRVCFKALPRAALEGQLVVWRSTLLSPNFILLLQQALHMAGRLGRVYCALLGRCLGLSHFGYSAVLWSGN